MVVFHSSAGLNGFQDCTKLSHCQLLQLASCLIYAWSLLEYVIFILWVRSFSKMLPPVKSEEDKVLV